MKYYAINLKLAGKDVRTGKRYNEYQVMLIADNQELTEAFIKNRARELYDDMWVEQVIQVTEISEQDYKAGMEAWA